MRNVVFEEISKTKNPCCVPPSQSPCVQLAPCDLFSSPSPGDIHLLSSSPSSPPYLPSSRIMMMRKTKPEEDKTKMNDVQMRTSVSALSSDLSQPPPPTVPMTTTATTSTLKDNKDKEKAAPGGDTISAVRGGVLKNGIYYSESELAEQSAITWNPCYWTKERISKWVDEVEHPDTLKTIAKSLSPTNGASS